MESKEITFSYDDKVRRLHHINATVNKGEITTIIGPNGCGKSTLLGVLTNNLMPDGGSVVLDGKILNQYKPKELAKRLGVVHQHNIAPADMTVEKLVFYGRLPYQRTFSPHTDEDQKIVDWALKHTGLEEKREAAIETLSGGQQQRAWIAMALAQKTPYLFLDEPTSNLDIFYQYDILKLVKQLRDEQGLTIVMVLHDITQAIQFSDSIIAMKKGHIVKQGNPKEIMTAELIDEIYGVEVVVKHDEELGMYIVPLSG